MRMCLISMEVIMLYFDSQVQTKTLTQWFGLANANSEQQILHYN